jgi:hypothetical protein
MAERSTSGGVFRVSFRDRSANDEAFYFVWGHTRHGWRILAFDRVTQEMVAAWRARYLRNSVRRR